MVTKSNKNVVLGIGNCFLSDAGAGVKTIRHILKSDSTGDNLVCIEGDNMDYSMIQELENANTLIIIDAANLNKKPGTVSCLVGSAMDHYFQRQRGSLNESIMARILEMMRLAEHSPAHRALIAIEPKNVQWGKRLSTTVARAVPVAAKQALALIANWESSQNLNDKHQLTK